MNKFRKWLQIAAVLFVAAICSAFSAVADEIRFSVDFNDVALLQESDGSLEISDKIVYIEALDESTKKSKNIRAEIFADQSSTILYCAFYGEGDRMLDIISAPLLPEQKNDILITSKQVSAKYAKIIVINDSYCPVCPEKIIMLHDIHSSTNKDVSDYTILLDSFNTAPVRNGSTIVQDGVPLRVMPFQVSNGVYHIDAITTYHWNYGQGVTPGTIAIYQYDNSDDANDNVNGTPVGIWNAAGRSGSGADNVFWDVFPDVDLYPGHYAIVDSAPDTWSSNEESNGLYFTQIRGFSSPIKNVKDYPILLDSFNTSTVQNGSTIVQDGVPLRVMPFQVSNGVYHIDAITTYHWNYGQGVTPGTIAIYQYDNSDDANDNVNGTPVGIWNAAGRSGSGADNVFWDVFPDVDLYPGHYAIVDSDPDTWSSNEESNGLYFTQIRGHLN